MAIIRDLTVLGNSRLAGKAAGTDIQADKFITNGGTANQAVLGDGTLKPLSEIGSIPNDGSFEITADTGSGTVGTAAVFSADSDDDCHITLSNTATTGHFTLGTSGNSYIFNLTEIDGGIWS